MSMTAFCHIRRDFKVSGTTNNLTGNLFYGMELFRIENCLL